MNLDTHSKPTFTSFRSGDEPGMVFVSAPLTKLAKLEKKAEQRDDRRQIRRDELAQSAIATLAQLGYFRTSLRDIAEHCGKSVGLIHYYFEDKEELIAHCVRVYKRELIRTVDALLEEASTPEEAQQAFVEAMVFTVGEQATSHRIWYDINAQAMFEPRFERAIAEIEQQLVEMIGRVFAKCDIDPNLMVEGFTSIEGAFHYYLFQYLSAQPRALERFREQLHGGHESFPTIAAGRGRGVRASSV